MYVKTGLIFDLYTTYILSGFSLDRFICIQLTYRAFEFWQCGFRVQYCFTFLGYIVIIHRYGRSRVGIQLVYVVFTYCKYLNIINKLAWKLRNNKLYVYPYLIFMLLMNYEVISYQYKIIHYNQIGWNSFIIYN
jgi:hypothetical protein